MLACSILLLFFRTFRAATIFDHRRDVELEHITWAVREIGRELIAERKEDELRLKGSEQVANKRNTTDIGEDNLLGSVKRG